MVRYDRIHKVEFNSKGVSCMENAMRGAVLGRFHTITDFANAMKWDRKKASRIVNRVQKPSAEDMEKMAEILEVQDADSFVRIFLPTVSTMWEK